MIKTEKLFFSYTKNPVLHSVNITINKGDFLGIVGPNGSGKSTLIRCLDGILVPQKGSVSLNNTPLNKLSREEISRNIAYVPQHEECIFTSTVYDTILLGRKPFFSWSPTNKDHKKVKRILKILELEDSALNRLNELSGGQRQRVYIGRALAQEPDLLLMDEPTANLDFRHTLDVLKLLKDLSANGITVAIAIHDLNMAAKFCSRILLLKKGKVFADGGPEIMTPNTIGKLYNIKVELIERGNNKFFLPIE